MNIYTSWNYKGGREESRRLLTLAIANYIADEGLDCEETAEELVSRIELGENGKPFIPGWHHFSISHSDDAWAVLISETECGLDIQFAQPVKSERIGERFFAPEDAQAIIEGDDDCFFRIWTRREAAVKAIGATVFSSVPTVLNDLIELNGETWFLNDIELLGADVVPYGAMCTRGIPINIHYYRL